MLLLWKVNLKWDSKWVSLILNQINMKIIFIGTKLVILLLTQMQEILYPYTPVWESNNKRNSIKIAISREDSKKMSSMIMVLPNLTLKDFMSFLKMTWNQHNTQCGSLSYWAELFNIFNFYCLFLPFFQAKSQVPEKPI